MHPEQKWGAFPRREGEGEAGILRAKSWGQKIGGCTEKYCMGALRNIQRVRWLQFLPGQCMKGQAGQYKCCERSLKIQPLQIIVSKTVSKGFGQKGKCEEKPFFVWIYGGNA